MQFRQKTHRDKDGNIRQGQTVQLMRYTYDAENKRGRQVMIGSFKVEDPRLPPEVEALLTPQEKAEFEEWKRAQQQAVAHEKLAAVLDTLDDVMTRSCMALDVGAGTVKDPARRHCCKVSDEAAFCLIQRPYVSKTLLTRRISPRGSP